jgi:hypothetical protein
VLEAFESFSYYYEDDNMLIKTTPVGVYQGSNCDYAKLILYNKSTNKNSEWLISAQMAGDALSQNLLLFESMNDKNTDVYLHAITLTGNRIIVIFHSQTSDNIDLQELNNSLFVLKKPS